VQNGVSDCLVQALGLSNHELIKVALQGIENIVKHGLVLANESNEPNPFITSFQQNGGIEKLKHMQTHPEVGDVCLRILEGLSEA